MSNEHEDDAVTIAVTIGDTLLADRIVALLGDVAGVRLVAQGEQADIVLVSADARVPATEDESYATAASALRVSTPVDFSLTPRELEVLALLADGASNKTIARRLGISVHTAKFHVGSLLDKLDATGRTDAVIHAARLGVIEL